MLNQLRSGLISVQELYSSCSQRITKTQSLNAFVRITENVSQAQAEESSRRYAKGNPRNLEGLPIAIKDNFCTLGIPTTCASKMLETFIPPYNATVVEKLFNAGAILMGKTNMDEFGMGSGTTEGIFGPTKNVWGSPFLEFQESTQGKPQPVDNFPSDFVIAGGSSGGSAVAVASGTCWGALGSDTGGSVRNPASYCGLIGFKPSYGSLSRHGLIPLVNSMDVPALLTRSVNDCRLMFDAIKGYDEKDSTTIRRSLKKSKFQACPENLNGLRVGIPKEFHCLELSDEVIEAWSEIAVLMEQNGAIVSDVSLPHTAYSIACYSVLNPCEVASNMARYDGLRYGFRANGSNLNSTESLFAASRSQAFNHIVRGRIFAGNYFLLKQNYHKYFVQALKLRRLIYEDYAKVWNEVDVLLTPVTLSDAPLFSEFASKDSRAQSADQDYCTQPANMAGIPAISFPVKLSKRKLPLSLQLMAPFFEDETLLDITEFIERLVKFPTPAL